MGAGVGVRLQLGWVYLGKVGCTWLDFTRFDNLFRNDVVLSSWISFESSIV